MNKRFVVGIDRAKMRLYDCNEQSNIIDSGQSKDDAVDIVDVFNTGSNSSFTDFKV